LVSVAAISRIEDATAATMNPVTVAGYGNVVFSPKFPLVGRA
jgi:hypothetical protein